MRPGTVVALLLSSSGCTQLLGVDDFTTGSDVVDGAPADTNRDAPDATPVDCSERLACPAAESGTVSLCGIIRDIGTDAQLASSTPTGLTCGAGGQADGCLLDLAVYDALSFAMDPDAALPLEVEDLRFDDCGRYVAGNVPRTGIGYFAVVIDDADAQPDVRRRTAVGTVAPDGASLELDVFSITTSLDNSWAAQVGFTAGNTYVDRGAILGIFSHDGAPVAGVTMTRQGVAAAADDSYFSDTSATEREVIGTSASVTGANGSALMLNSNALVQHSGIGGETGGCAWSSVTASHLPGILYVIPFACT